MRKNFNLPEIRERLAQSTGKKYWRSLEEVAQTEEFKDFLNHEFPQGADQWLNPIGRRNFLKLMGASLALGGLAACSPQQAKQIVPYVKAPEEIIPGQPLFYATAFQLGGVATGVVAESNMGRPTKIEGNPDHPASLGGTNAQAQASVLDLYDPDRSQTVTNGGLVSAWDSFLGEFIVEVSAQGMTGGAGLRLLTGPVTSPLMASQIEQLLENYPDAKVIQYDPIDRDNEYEGALMAFGQDVNTVYQFDKAKVVVSLEADFMAAGTPGDVRYAHDFAEARRVRSDKAGEMNRMYVVESTPSITGAIADHRLPIQSSKVQSVALTIAAELGVGTEAPPDLHGIPEEWIDAVVEDLQAHAGESLVVAGRTQPPIVHALAHAINQTLGNVGNTVIITEPLIANATNQYEAMRQLAEDMANEVVGVLVILDSNPVYTAPADLDFVSAMQKVPFRVHLSIHEDETSSLCQWHIPAKHYLEKWADARAFDGTVTFTQPLIDPLYPAARSPIEMLAVMLGQADATEYDLVREFWAGQGIDDQTWKESLYNGFVAGTELPAKQLSIDANKIASASKLEAGVAAEADKGLEIVFRPDPSVYDGQFANNGWLQELPKPSSKLTWDNAVWLSPHTAEQIGLAPEDVIILDYEGRTIYAPVWVQPGQADDAVTVFLGYGRQRVGRVGNGIGANAYAFRTSEAPWFDKGLTVRKSGETYRLASTQMHWNMEGRYPVRAGTFEMYKEDPAFVKHIGEHEVDPNLSLMPGWDYNSYAWGMVVDLNTCNGCNACITACQAENNIPVVGKEQVLVGREMHWMRLDTYYEGELDNPHTYLQPMMCHHCEQAPCELVCPVNATVHDAEGLNLMVYNRCIGTRYCSNNCPYKVRRFNYLQFVDQDTESIKGARNPNVTVRVRGVMEKCTYCLQRISKARIAAKNENRRIRDGEVVTACQSACPTKAISFGDTNDPDSQVAKLIAEPSNYGVLTELGVRPRTSYLVKMTNPHPALAGDHAADAEHHG
jgi:molybdopterin-containing oxidoreductase family iron-sulfur binding subunit